MILNAFPLVMIIIIVIIVLNLLSGTGSGSHLSFPNPSAPLTDDTSVNLSLATATLHRLSLRNEEPAVPVTEDNCALVFPSHLQTLAADCSQLSFGTYKASSNSAFSEPLGSNPLKLDRGKASVAIDGSYGHLDSRYDSLTWSIYTLIGLKCS